MALNKYMHPRNTYKSRKPDFKALASKYEYFNDKTTVSDSGKVMLDFKDPAALRVLTQALLEDDFGLTVTIPLDRLIPTVPQRLNYILWLEDMIGQNRAAKGIDIGTGACCIYPLLGCRQNKWKFLASDIDDQNILFANRNISNNKMENEIKVKKVTEDTILIGLLDEGETYDFCMCNPPFYSDHLEAQGITSSRSDGRSDSSSVSTASEAESIAWGGEVRFVSQMIEESLKLKDRVRLFTSLLGKKTSLSLLKDVLSRNKIDKYSTTEFCQGRTMRWGIAWTFDENIKFPKSFFREKKNEKPPITHVLSRESSLVVGDYTVQAFTWFMWKQLEELKIYFHVYHSGKFYSCFSMKCMKNTWSHQRRKKRQQQREHGTTQTADTVEQTAENIVDSSVESKNESTEAVVEVDTRNDTTSDIVSDTSASANVNNMTEIPVEKNIEKVETRKRLAEDSDSECLAKKSRIESNDNNVTDDSNEITTSEGDNDVNKESLNNDKLATDSSNEVKTSEGDNDVNKESLNNDKLATDNSNEMKTFEVVSDVNIESMNNDKPVTDSSNEMKTSEGDHDVNKESGNKDKSNTLNRKEIIEQFWKEQEENSGKSGAGKKKVASSFYECLEPFKTDDECLLMCKVVLRKEEGVISLTLTHLAGNKEAMHQIMQFFKNKFTVQKK